MIFYSRQHDISYDNRTTTPGNPMDVEIDESANAYYVKYKKLYNINVNNIPDGKITVDGIKEYGVDTEALKRAKLDEVNVACENAIYTGFDIETSAGMKHFSMSPFDQMEIAELSLRESEEYLYHADGEAYRLWSKEDFDKIAVAAYKHKTYNRLYCNCLRRHIKCLDDNEAIFDIYYGMELPEDLHDMLEGLAG